MMAHAGDMKMPDKILSVAGNSFATTNQSQNAICVGDKISLFVEDFNGFVSADGFTDNSLSVMCLRQDEICVPRFESCVFQVQVKQNYHAKVELETFLENLGASNTSTAIAELTPKQKEQYRVLCAKTAQEQKQNDEDIQIYLGRELRHSMPVQLLHVKSQKYIKVCLGNAADAEGSNISVILTNVGAASSFRFRSRHNLKLADDPVCDLDAVFVVPEDLADTHFLNCDVDLARLLHTWPRKMNHQVAALLTGMTCLIQLYSHANRRPPAIAPSMPDEVKPTVPIQCGQLVRLYHSKLDVFLATSPASGSVNSLIVLEDANGFNRPGAATRLEQPSAYSMWIVESANPTLGAALFYDQQIRLRNLATDGYLCPNKDNTTVIAKEISSWSANGKSQQKLVSSICYFSRMDEQSTDDTEISKQSVVWLKFKVPGPLEHSAEIWVQTTGDITSPNLELGNALSPTDGFVLYPVDEAILKSPFQIVSVSRTVREYIMIIQEKGFCAETDPDTIRIIGILKELMKLLSRPPNSGQVADKDKDTHDGLKEAQDSEGKHAIEREIHQSQSIIRELQLMDDLIELVDFRAWSLSAMAGFCVKTILSLRMAERERERERQKQRERTILRETGMLEEESNKMNRVDPQVQTNNLKHSITSLRNSVDMVLTRELCEVVFQLLGLSTRGNDRNGVHMSQSIATLIHHYTGYEGVSSSSADEESNYLKALRQCILDIYTDNTLVLSSMNAEMVGQFVDLLVGQKDLTPTYVGFISSLIQFKRKPIVSSVKGLADLLVQQPAYDAVPRTTMRGNEILVLMPSFGGVPAWLPVEEVLRNPLQAEYYNAFLSLFSVLCCGRTKTIEKVLDRLLEASFFSMDLCVSFLVREDIPYRTRAASTSLLAEAFIDCNPQVGRCGVETLQIWSDIYNKPVVPNVPFPAKYGGIVQPLKIKDTILKFIESSDIQGLDVEKDTFCLSMINLLRHSIYFGFFNHTLEWVFEHEHIGSFPHYKQRFEDLLRYLDPRGASISNGSLAKKTVEVEILVQPIILLLDPSTDHVTEGSRVSDLMIQTKIVLCAILELICRLRLRVRVNRLLQVYDEDLSYGLVSKSDAKSIKNAPKFEARRPVFEQIFDILRIDNQALTKILGDLLRFGDEALDNRALKLMLRIYRERHELVVTMQNTVLLVNQTVINTYLEHRAILHEMEDLVLTFNLLVDEVNIRREEERIEKHLADQQEMLENEVEEEVDETTQEMSMFGFLKDFSSDSLNLPDNIDLSNLGVGLSNVGEGLTGGLDAIANLGGGLTEGLTQGLSSGLGLGDVFTTKKTEKKKSNQRMSVSMMARLGRRKKDGPADAKGSRGTKKLQGKKDEDEEEHEEDEKKLKLRKSMHRERPDADEELTVVLQRNCRDVLRHVQHLVSDCSAGLIKLPLVKLQHGLVDLHAHIRLLDILRAIDTDLTLIEMPNMFELLRETCKLVTWFVKDNVHNASLINTEIDLLLKLMEHPRALEFGIDEVIAALYNNNRNLCTQAPQKVESKIIPLICGNARRYPYIKMLTTLMGPNGMAIKRNQARILKILNLQAGKTLDLFDGDEGLRELQSLLRRREYLSSDIDSSSRKDERGQSVPSHGAGLALKEPNPKQEAREQRQRAVKGLYEEKPLYDPVMNMNTNYDSKVMYYLYTLRLFTTACLQSNYVTESICCKLVPIRRCSEIITANWIIGEIKVAMLEFLEEAHLQRERPKLQFVQDRAQDENMWVIFDYFATMLFKIMDPNEKKSYCLPKEKPDLTKKITGYFLSVGKVFFGYFRLKSASEYQLKIANRVCDAAVKYWAEFSKVSSEQRALSDMIFIMSRNGISGNDSSKRMVKTLLEADRINLIESADETKLEVFYTEESALFPFFVHGLKTRIHEESEIKELGETCRSQWRSFQVITSQLVSNSVDAALKAKYIEILQSLWETLTEEGTKIEKIIEAMKLDVVIRALMLLVSKGVEVRRSLTLANSFLSRGGRAVQKCFLVVLRERGPPEMLFKELATRIEIAEEEAKEFKALYGQVTTHVRERANQRLTLQEIFNAYNAGKDSMAMEDAEQNVIEESFIDEVLSFVKNLTEGHYHEMQNLMREQKQDHSINLVAAIVHFVTEVSDLITPINVGLIQRAYDTLTEFMQGPNKGNILDVLQTNIFDTTRMIIIGTHADLSGCYYPKEYLDQVRDLKCSVVTSLLAMMEASSGSEVKIPMTIIEQLDLQVVLDYANTLFRTWSHNINHQMAAGLSKTDQVLAKMNAGIISTGFKYYILLRSLADFQNIATSNLKAAEIFDQIMDTSSSPAMRYYAQQVGCLEIARDTRGHDTEIIKIYFQVPSICSRITRKMKDEILWTVDRTNDVTRLRDFFSRCDDLYYDMKYQEWLNSNNLTVLIKKIGNVADAFYLGNVILINVLLLIYFRWRDPLESDPEATWQEMRHVDLSGSAKIALTSVLPSVQLVLEVVMLINYTISSVPSFVRKKFKEAHIGADLQDADGNKIPFEYDRIPRDLRYLWKYVRFVVCDNNFYSGQCFMWRLVTVTLALAINTYTVTSTDGNSSLALLFYFLLLWEVFPRSKQIGFVIKAVIVGGSQLLALFGMLLIFTYWFGVIGFIAFPDKFQFRKAEIVDGSTVQNSVATGWGNNRAVPLQYVWQGMIMVVDQGVRKDDVGEALDKFNWPVPCPNPADYGCEPCPGISRTFECILDRYPAGISEYPEGSKPCTNPEWQAKLDGYLAIEDCADVFTSWPQAKIFIRMVYTFMFFVMVSAIGLEIVFGIIVDSFKALREEREETDKDIRFKCFICGINRDVFDSKIMEKTAGKTGFDSHTDNDHNMWTYMYFLIHIREIDDKKDLNGVETYVYEKAIMNDVSFFPVARSMRLDVMGGLHDPVKEARQRKQADVAKVEHRTHQLLTSVTRNLDELLFANGLSARKKTQVVDSSTTSLNRIIQSTPAAVREANTRSAGISTKYEPLGD